MEDRFVRVGEAARYLGITPRFLARLRREGKGPPAYAPTGAQHRYLLSELEAWVKGKGQRRAIPEEDDLRLEVLPACTTGSAG